MTPKALQLLEEFAEQGTMSPDRRAALALLLVEHALLRHRVERVLELHSRRTSSGACTCCLEGYIEEPCRTVRILDGGEP